MGSVKLQISGRECFFPVSSSIKSLELTSFLLALLSEPRQTGTRMFWKGCDLQGLPFGHFKKQFKNLWMFKTCSFQLQFHNTFFTFHLQLFMHFLSVTTKIYIVHYYILAPGVRNSMWSATAVTESGCSPVWLEVTKLLGFVMMQLFKLNTFKC